MQRATTHQRSMARTRNDKHQHPQREDLRTALHVLAVATTCCTCTPVTTNDLV